MSANFRYHNSYLGLTPDRAVFDKLISQLSSKLDSYDVILGKQKYLAGNVSSQFLIVNPNTYI